MFDFLNIAGVLKDREVLVSDIMYETSVSVGRISSWHWYSNVRM